MNPFTFSGHPTPGPAPHEWEASLPQLAVLCLSGRLGGLELNSLKFAS